MSGTTNLAGCAWVLWGLNYGSKLCMGVTMVVASSVMPLHLQLVGCWRSADATYRTLC